MERCYRPGPKVFNPSLTFSTHRVFRVVNLYWDESKLQSYIDNFLVPVATGLKNHPALFAWEIVNEPEGIVHSSKTDPEPCFDSSILSSTGAGWAKKWLPMERILKFINLQAAAIKDIEGNSVFVTSSSWSEKTNTDSFGNRNYYTDSCLVKAGGKASGVLDFYQIHTYRHNSNGLWSDSQPMENTPADYQLNKVNNRNISFGL